MILRWFRASLMKKLVMVVVIVLIALFTVAGGVYMHQSNEYAVAFNRQAAEMTIKSALDNVDYHLREAENLAILVALEKGVQTAFRELSGVDNQPFDYLYQSHILKDTINHYLNTHSYISGVLVITTDGHVLNEELLANSEQVMKNVFLAAFAGAPEKVQFIGDAKPMYLIPGNRVISCVRKIYGNDGREVIGYIQVDMQAGKATAALDSLSLNGSPCIGLFGQDGKLIYRKTFGDNVMTEQDFLALSASEGQDVRFAGVNYFAVRMDSSVSGWRIVGLVPRAGWTDSLGANSMVLAVTLLCLVFSALAISSMLRSSFTPMRAIVGAIEQIERGDFGVRIHLNSRDEFQYIAECLNHMTEQLSEMMERLERERALKQDAELYALQAQINPHFLHNTLTAVRVLTCEGDAERAGQVTDALVRLCEACLGSGKELLSLEEETRLLMDYCAILKARYADAFEVRVDMEEGLAPCRIPRFTLQPLVENAVYHGILINHSGHVLIDIRSRDGDIHILVEDDGVGMEPDRVDELNRCIEERIVEAIYAPGAINSIGMANVSNRIKLCFGTEYGLAVESGPGAGTRVSIRIPRMYPKGE